MQQADIVVTHERELYANEAKEIADRASMQYYQTMGNAEGDIRRLQGELAGAKLELMQVKPARAGYDEHNKHLARHVETQQLYIAHLESMLEQSQYQMSHLQNGCQDMRTAMQEKNANSKHAFKQEAEQLMEIE